MAKRKRRQFHYKHTAAALVAILLFVLAIDTAIVQAGLHYLEDLGLIGVFIAGIMFTSFFTTVPSIALLALLVADFNPLVIGLVGGAGSLVGDWVILKVFEEKIAHELEPLAKKLGFGGFLSRIRRKKERERTLVLGMLAIMSPLPDELGIGLLGLSKFPLTQLFTIIYVLNSLGIMLVAVIAKNAL